MAVVAASPRSKGKIYRAANEADVEAFNWSVQALEELKGRIGAGIVPTEATMADRPSPNSRGLSGVVRYGFEHFGKFFNERQTLALCLFAHHIKSIGQHVGGPREYQAAVASLLAMNLDRLADLANNLVVA